MTARARVTSRLAQVGVALGLVAALHTPAAAQADPFIGTWTLNVAKSTYPPAPAPKSGVSMYTAVDGGYRISTTGTDGAGKPTKTEYSAKLDGKDNPVAGPRIMTWPV